MKSDLIRESENPTVRATVVLSSLPICLGIAILGGERLHDPELSGHDLQATPYEINHKTCFDGWFLDSGFASKSDDGIPYRRDPLGHRRTGTRRSSTSPKIHRDIE